MKQNIRILGVDDGPFQRDIDSRTALVGVLMRMDGTLESVHSGFIDIDGEDTLSLILEFIEEIGNSNVNVILTEGITFGGFDIVDPTELWQKTGIPFISITKGKADLQSMESALIEHGNSEKLHKLRSLTPVRKIIRDNVYTLNISGVDQKEAISLVEKLMIVGNVPEPLRLADMMALSFKRTINKLP